MPGEYLTPAEIEQLNRLGALGSQQKLLADQLRAAKERRIPIGDYADPTAAGIGAVGSFLGEYARQQETSKLADQLRQADAQRAKSLQAAQGALGRLPSADPSGLYSSDPAQVDATRAALADALRGKEQLGMQFLASGDPQLAQLGAGLLGSAEKMGGYGFEVAGKRFDVGARADESQKDRTAQMDRLTYSTTEEGKRQTATLGAQASRQKDELAAAEKRLGMEIASREKIEGGKAEAAKTKAAADATEGLRKEFNGNPVVKSFHEVSTAMRKVEQSAATPSAAGDMALIFSYMKMLDPGSTVREGEYANAQNATGVPGQIINLYNKAKDGQLLNPQMRRDFAGQARSAFAAHKAEYDSIAGQYQGLAAKQGLDPADVVGFGLTDDEAARLKALEAKEAAAGGAR